MVKLIVQVLIIGLPSYTVAWLTGKMVYTIVTLAITSLIASSLFRVEEDADVTEE